MAPRIFVSIASYRDTECQWTVKSHVRIGYPVRSRERTVRPYCACYAASRPYLTRRARTPVCVR